MLPTHARFLRSPPATRSLKVDLELKSPSPADPAPKKKPPPRSKSLPLAASRASKKKDPKPKMLSKLAQLVFGKTGKKVIQNEVEFAEKVESVVEQKKEKGKVSAVVLLDGDGDKFQRAFLEQGYEGGQKAANEVCRQVLKEVARITKLGIENVQVLVHVFWNEEGFIKYTLTTESLPTARDTIPAFRRGFCASQFAATMSDSGPEDQSADEAIIRHLSFYISHHDFIFIGGCHDKGYAKSLSILSDDQVKKVVLARTHRRIEPSISILGLRQYSFAAGLFCNWPGEKDQRAQQSISAYLGTPPTPPTRPMPPSPATRASSAASRAVSSSTNTFVTSYPSISYPPPPPVIRTNEAIVPLRPKLAPKSLNASQSSVPKSSQVRSTNPPTPPSISRLPPIPPQYLVLVSVLQDLRREGVHTPACQDVAKLVWKRSQDAFEQGGFEKYLRRAEACTLVSIEGGAGGEETWTVELARAYRDHDHDRDW